MWQNKPKVTCPFCFEKFSIPDNVSEISDDILSDDDAVKALGNPASEIFDLLSETESFYSEDDNFTGTDYIGYRQHPR